MFETYLIDAHHFIDEVQIHIFDGDTSKIRSYRASIFLTSSALEAFINYIGETFKENTQLTLHERDFLNDIQTEVNAKDGTLKKKEKYQSLENKIRFLIAKFGIEFDYLNSPNWSQFKEFKIFRDQLVHPREEANDFVIADYKKHAERGLKVTIALIDTLLVGIFSKNLRIQVLELSNVEPCKIATNRNVC